MTEETRKIQLGVEVDATGAKAGFEGIKQGAQSMAQGVAQAGQTASKGIDGIGAATESLNVKQSRLLESIKRSSIIATEGKAAYLEQKAAMAGVADAASGYIAKLKTAEQGQSQLGMSSKATAAALRGVPAQFTDIITSLQAGQKPISVLLQQGGQLKDMFGGIGPAARALGGYVAGLINPFTLAAVAIGVTALALHEGAKELRGFENALTLTGNAIGLSTAQFSQLRDSVGGIATKGKAAEVLTEIAANGRIAGTEIKGIAEAAILMEKATGQATSKTIAQFEELARSPVEASAKLNEQYHFLTTAVFQQIKALEDQGRAVEAANLAEKTYAEALKARATTVIENAGLLERAWRGVTGAAKSAWDTMLGIGRETTVTDKAQILRDRIESNLRQRAGEGQTGKEAIDKGTAVLREQLNLLTEQDRMLRRGAEAQGERARIEQLGIGFIKQNDEFLTKEQRMRKELTRATVEGQELVNAGKIKQSDLDLRLANIREKFKESTGLQIDKAKLGLDVEKIKNASEELLGVYTNSEKIIESLRSAGLMSDKEYYESKRAFINLETQAKETALEKEIARYQQEKLTGKDRLDNEKKIADTASKLVVVRADSSSKLIVLANQEAAANTKLQLSYLSARQASQDYFDTLTRQQDREISSMGQGTQKRNFNSGINQIEDRYAGQRRDLENQKAQLELEGKFTEEARQQYEQRLSIINEFQTKSIDSYKAYYDKLMEQQGDWALGASEGLQNYLDQSKNVFKQTEDLVTNAFKGMEDALVSFVTTGKLDFKSLAQSIIADIARIIIKQQISNALGVAGGKSGSGGFGGLLGSLFGGGGGSESMIGNMGADSIVPGFDGGGFTGPGSRTGGIDGKGGFPAILHPNETVIDHTRGQGASGSVSVQVSVDASGSKVQGDDQKSDQLGKRIGAVIRQVLVEEKMPGGILA